METIYNPYPNHKPTCNFPNLLPLPDMPPNVSCPRKGPEGEQRYTKYLSRQGGVGNIKKLNKADKGVNCWVGGCTLREGEGGREGGEKKTTTPSTGVVSRNTL